MKMKSELEQYTDFHEELLKYVYTYFQKNDLADKYKLFKLYCDIITDYNRRTLNYDWRKEIRKLRKEYKEEYKDDKIRIRNFL